MKIPVPIMAEDASVSVAPLTLIMGDIDEYLHTAPIADALRNEPNFSHADTAELSNVCSESDTYSFMTRGENNMIYKFPLIYRHPKMQAGFISHIVSEIKDRERKFVIFTHSDAMMDRALIEIMKGNLAPVNYALNYVSFLDSRIHHITHDKEGNLYNTPKEYREWELKETNRSIGFLDDGE